MCLIISLAMPLDKARPCFAIATTIFGLISIVSIVGMTFYLASAGFYPHKAVFDPYDNTWTQYPETHFSWLCLAGVIMLCIYLVPILFRPVDFLENFKGYIVGLIAYLVLIPLFANIFSIYSMSNLHDISWGNRPTTGAGTEAFTAKVEEQKNTENNYKSYRANFLFFWLCCNGVYFVSILILGEIANGYVVNDGTFNVLTGFALYLAGIVVFRVVFSALYLSKWHYRYTCDKKYYIPEVNLESVFKKYKKMATTGADSTDDEIILEKAKEYFKNNRKQILSKSKRLENKKKLKTKNILQATMAFVHDNDIS